MVSVKPPSARPNASPSASDSKRIDEQLVDELWSRARSSLPAFVGVMLVVWPIVHGPASRSDAIRAAYLGAIAVGIVRWVAAIVLVPRLDKLSRATRYGAMVAGAVATGVALGVLDVLLFRELDPLGLGLWIMIVAGIVGGATISLGARPEIFFAYVIPAVGAFIVAPLLWPRGQTGLVIGAMSIWIVHALVQVTHYRKSRRELLQLHLELDANVHRLHANNAELARKNVELVEISQRADRIFAALAEALPGKVLSGKYRLESRIGAGGFSIVFRGTHLDLGRPVAVKIFRPQAGNDSAASLERFRYEGMASSRVRHPNIVDVIDAGISADGIPYIAMELLDGSTLEQELAATPRLPLERIAPIMEHVCRGLDAAHAANIVHRDVKPDNIFLHHDRHAEVVKMLDFGIAKIVDAGRLHERNITSTGDFIGTPYYMAPERLLGRECDGSADVYSVGVILFRALTGRLPFEGTLAEIMMQAVSKRPPDVGSLAPSLPTAIAQTIMRALEEDPRQRPTAAELAAVLAQRPTSAKYRLGGAA